jgi:hypothetical protein
MATLLDHAKATIINRTSPHPLTSEEIELALAWVRGEVSTGQCARALRIKDQNVVSRLAVWLRTAVMENRITVGWRPSVISATDLKR